MIDLFVQRSEYCRDSTTGAVSERERPSRGLVGRTGKTSEPDKQGRGSEDFTIS